MSVCLFVCLYSINVKMAKPIGPFLWDLPERKGLWMDDRIFKNLPLTKIEFCYKICEFYLCFCFTMYTKRTCSQFK